MFLTVNASATLVTKENAAKVATNFLSGVVMPDGTTRAAVISETFNIQKEGNTVLYVFNFEKGGYAIVSADDRFSPILGYSPDGHYDEGNMPGAFEFLMEEFSDMIAFIQENNTAPEPEYTAQWERYASDNPTVRGTTSVLIAPMTALWNQGSPYNYYAPVTPGGKAYAGCVATAMSMIMYYWHWPWQGTGSREYTPSGYAKDSPCYGWDAPKLEANFGEAYYDYNGMYGTPEINAKDYMYDPIALLQYHAGIAVNMQYCSDGSGSNSQLARSAMVNYFQYDPSIKYVAKGNTPDADWADMLREQMFLKQPVYASGCASDGCHAFVCDGYDSDNKFHYNFGWDGQGNGYFIAHQPGEFTKPSDVAVITNFIPDRTKGYPIDCNRNWDVPYLKGMFTDGSEPTEKYQQGVTTTWLFDSKPFGNDIDYYTFTCNELDLASGDFLRFYDGADETTLLKEFTKGTALEPVKSTVGKVLVKFTSTASSTRGNGFLISYEAKSKQYCSGEIVLTAPSGQFTDGSPDDMNYAANSNCKWNIKPEGAEDPNTKITFEFLRLDTEAGKDEIKFYNNADAKPIEGSPISGSYGPGDELPTLVAEAKGVTVIFSPNAYLQGKGFEIRYSTSPVSIQEVENINDLSVYPNPATDKLNIKFNTATADDFNITIYNVTGQAVYKETLNNFIGSYYNEISVNDFAQGVYLMQVKSSKGAATRKIVIK